MSPAISGGIGVAAPLDPVGAQCGMDATEPLWIPDDERVAEANLTAFIRAAAETRHLTLGDYTDLHTWSLEDPAGPEGSTVFEQPQGADLLVATAQRNHSHRFALDSYIAQGIVKWPFSEGFDVRNCVDVDRLVADQSAPKGSRLQF